VEPAISRERVLHPARTGCRGGRLRSLSTFFLTFCTFVTLAGAADLAEENAAQWGTFADDGAPTATADEFTRVKVGRASVRFDTASGFDTGVTYPATADAHWDLSGLTFLVFWAYAMNENIHGFQGHQPVIVLNTPSGTVRIEASSTRMYNQAWHLYHVPLAGDSNWIRSDTGTPDLTDVLQLEIHHDTWDTGFTVFYDGVEFIDFTPGELPSPGPDPPPGVDPDAVEARVLLFIFDPVMENLGGARMHQAYGWHDPISLVTQIVSDLETASHGLARFTVAATVRVDDYPYFEDGYRYDDENYHQDWTGGTLHDSVFDYARFLADGNMAAPVAAGAIDEIWVYGAPGFGMWESTMAGDGGYWCNSAPVQGVASERLFVVMGWNFERGVAEAIHSFGHRAESIMVHSCSVQQEMCRNHDSQQTVEPRAQTIARFRQTPAVA